MGRMPGGGWLRSGAPGGGIWRSCPGWAGGPGASPPLDGDDDPPDSQTPGMTFRHPRLENFQTLSETGQLAGSGPAGVTQASAQEEKK